MTMSDSSTHDRAEARMARAKSAIAPNPSVRHTVERRSQPAWLACGSVELSFSSLLLLWSMGEGGEVDCERRAEGKRAVGEVDRQVGADAAVGEPVDAEGRRRGGFARVVDGV